jgi:hypothetical protein
MNKALILAALSLLLSFQSNAQAAKTLKKVITLEITEDGGSNGAAVAWHPVQKKYYAAMAGNTEYPMVVFDAKGKKVFEDGITTQYDVRGLWYNPFAKALQANGYGDFGWGQYALFEDGKPGDITTFHEGQQQPDAQSVGAYDPAKNLLYFLDEDGNLEQYSVKDTAFIKTIELHLGKKKTDKETIFENEDVIEEYNSAAIIFTGIKGGEIGLLNIENQEVELYSAASGYLASKLKLPEGIATYNMFNFSYCNGIYWFFNKELRTWTGCK